MERQEIINKFLSSDIMNKWHFFKYHFKFYNLGITNPFAESLVRLITEIENILPNVGLDYLKKIESISDKEKDKRHYDQLLQVLAELVVVHKAIVFNWGDSSNFLYEPFVGNSLKNPELVVKNKDFEIGLEVKAPEFLKKSEERILKPFQINMRHDFFKERFDENLRMLPRDNVVMDFLKSANSKFSEFKKQNSKFYSILFIVWDDYIYEPISSLINSASGLFTNNSFAKDSNGNILIFENVDCVIISKHLTQIVFATQERPFQGISHPLDYGYEKVFPWKVVIKNPNSKVDVPNIAIECFQALEISPILGAEYQPIDFVSWF